ncbi:permease [Candidatus Sulfurimonas baltica]|uniref:Permease n=1 Tax=Candidatus Sulfurimonas baltica TaxID=2740404 RepID=A0A7S7RNX8_9BACT|nr:permease [Candidatus Sulfurimonas baltica]QOY52903.1 permease [Candidatus Sulfurimonas baltica]
MKIKFKGLKFLAAVSLMYLTLFIFDTSNTLASIQKSGTILYNLLPIFLFIIFITAMLNYFLKPKEIIKHFGKESGIKGVIYSVLGGVLSHGPIYAWYGVLSDMRNEGVKDRLLVTFLYARAVKLPLLPFMIDLFGVLFTIIMTLYIILSSVAQGAVMEYLEKRR